MKRLLKYTLIANLSFLFLAVTFAFISFLLQNDSFSGFVNIFFIYIFPFFVIIIGGVYQWGETSLKSYLSGLLIGVVYMIFSFSFILVFFKLILNCIGDSCGNLNVTYLSIILTFISIIIINFIIYFIRKGKSPEKMSQNIQNNISVKQNSAVAQ